MKKEPIYRVANRICVGTGGTCAALEVYGVQDDVEEESGMLKLLFFRPEPGQGSC